jgi:hypothetical protein
MIFTDVVSKGVVCQLQLLVVSVLFRETQPNDINWPKHKSSGSTSDAYLNKKRRLRTLNASTALQLSRSRAMSTTAAQQSREESTKRHKKNLSNPFSQKSLKGWVDGSSAGGGHGQGHHDDELVLLP